MARRTKKLRDNELFILSKFGNQLERAEVNSLEFYSLRTEIHKFVSESGYFVIKSDKDKASFFKDYQFNDPIYISKRTNYKNSHQVEITLTFKNPISKDIAEYSGNIHPYVLNFMDRKEEHLLTIFDNTTGKMVWGTEHLHFQDCRASVTNLLSKYGMKK